jgi:hypothetical protein
MKTLYYASMIAVSLLLYSIRILAQTTNLRLDLTESMKLSFIQDSVLYNNILNQVSNKEPTSQFSGLVCNIPPNHFNDKSQQPNLTNWSDAHSSNYDASEITRRDHIRTNRLISGIGLATSYGVTVIGDFLFDDGYRKYTLIPVIGPFITIGIIESHQNEEYWPGAKGLLILSGVAQSALATYFIISLERHSKPVETKNLAIVSSMNSIKLRVQF